MPVKTGSALLVASLLSMTACSGEVTVAEVGASGPDASQPACLPDGHWEQRPSPAYAPSDYGAAHASGGDRLFLFFGHWGPSGPSAPQAAAVSFADDRWEDASVSAPPPR